ncbi:hypothetical protein [Paenibacillus spongiae]|uniref:ABC transporter permease n=1 Tax=Paenibacillus spongiae TaxID=2909671 RepID=A0ABY5SKS9_9BACL|nr:hypothetical protein [Paenibacillus spongiae]UVI33265.1 hypothetical protein L1F29_16085 [Paenibacillus spongiae]
MLRTLSTLHAIRISSAANVFLYYVQKLPLIGKLITDSHYYAGTNIKKAASVIVLILRLIWGFVSRLAYMGLLIYLPVTGFGSTLSMEDQLQLFIHIFFLLSFVIAGIGNISVLEPKREKYVAVKLMRLSPKRYMQASLGFRYVMFFIYLTPSVILFGSLLGASLIQAVLLTVTVTMWRVLCEYLHLKLFDKINVVLIKQTAIVWLVIGLGNAAAYAPLLLRQVPVTGSLLISWPSVLVITAAGVIASVQLARYRDYRSAVDAATKRDDPLLDLGRMMNEAQKTSVQSKDSDYSLERYQQDKLKSKEGYAYLNAIFFARHRSLIRQPVNKRLAIIGALGAAGAVIALMSDPAAHYLRSNLGAVFPYMFIAMYFMAVGERICKAMFFNCDLSLLRYSYYRRAAYEHFRIRLIRIMSLNLLIAAALGAAVMLITVAAGGDVLGREVLLLWVTIIALSVFFSIHHLFMYYIFQPYATELNVKNPLYYVVTMLISGLSGICIFVQVQAHIFSSIVITATLAYMLMALILVRKQGSRTFRVK